MYNEKKVNKKNKNKENEFGSRFFRKRTKRLLTNIDILFHKIMVIELIISSLLILLGVVALLFPSVSIKIISILLGLTIIAYGITNIYSYFKRKEIAIFKSYIMYGIIACIVGLLMLINPFAFSQLMTIIFGIYILYLAVNKFDFALKLKKIEEKSWTILLASSILESLISILIFVNPFSNLSIMQLVGSFLILSGIINWMNTLLIKNRALDFMENL